MTDESIAFPVRLGEQDWVAERRAWRCEALRIPGAVLDGVYANGVKQDEVPCPVVPDVNLVRWIGQRPPSAISATIKLTEGLSLRSSTERWRKIAIVLPLIGSLLAAAIGAGAAYYSRTPAPIPGPPNTVTPLSWFGHWYGVSVSTSPVPGIRYHVFLSINATELVPGQDLTVFERDVPFPENDEGHRQTANRSFQARLVDKQRRNVYGDDNVTEELTLKENYISVVTRKGPVVRGTASLVRMYGNAPQ
jgi:hypothetical protein